MTNDNYEPEDKDLKDEYIAWLRETSPAKNIPDENFISLFDTLCLPENKKKQSYEPDDGPLTDEQMDWIRKQTFPLKKEDCEIDDLLDELEKRLLNKA